MTSGLTAMARAMHRRCCWPPERLNALCFSLSLTSSHSAARDEALLDDVVHLDLHAVDLRAEGDVVVDRLRERVGLLEDHPDPASHLDRADAGPVERLAVVVEPALDAGAGDEVVHPVQAAEERALAAARRADQGGDLVAPDAQRHVAQRLERAVVEVEALDAEHDLDRTIGHAVGDDLRHPGRGGRIGQRHGLDVVVGHAHLAFVVGRTPIVARRRPSHNVARPGPSLAPPGVPIRFTVRSPTVQMAVRVGPYGRAARWAFGALCPRGGHPSKQE